MGDCMIFPETFDEFAEEYKIVDTKEVYTNGTELIPIFRVRQWLMKPKTNPKTNYDRIKQISIDELARFLAEHIDNYRAPYEVKEIYQNAIDDKTGKGIIWIEAFKRWLESEVQGE